MTLEANVTRLLISYNSGDVLPISHIDTSALKTLVVDNASQDDSRMIATNLGYDVLALDANYGYGGAIMAGLNQLSCEFVLIANPDLLIEPDDIACLIEAARRYPDADLFVPSISKENGQPFFRHKSRFEKKPRTNIIPAHDACITMVSGAALFVRRASFIAHGGFDTAIFLYFEDDDLSLRYQTEKRQIIYVPQAHSKHIGNSSSSETADLNTLKDLSFGWSWAYVQNKYSIGSRELTIARIIMTLTLMALTLRVKQVKRRWRVLKGYLMAYRGERAPYLP